MTGVIFVTVYPTSVQVLSERAKNVMVVSLVIHNVILLVTILVSLL